MYASPPDASASPWCVWCPWILFLAGQRLGFLEGMGDVGPEFFEPLPEDELRLWNGEGE